MNVLIDRKDCVVSTPQVALKDHCLYNPSVLAFQDRLLCCFRASTAEKRAGTVFDYCLPPHREFYNEIIMAELDDNLAVQQSWQIDSRSLQIEQAPCGFEDCRLFSADGQTLEAIANVPGEPLPVEPDGKVGYIASTCRVGRLTFDAEYALTGLELYDSPTGARMEKNWSPFTAENALRFAYYWDPVIIFQAQPNGAAQPLLCFEETSTLEGYRGSTPGIPLGDGHLFVVHRRFDHENKIYFVYKLVELGPDFAPRRVSEEFHFINDRVLEYCAGLTGWGNRYIFSLGLNDRGSCLVSVDAATVEEMLHPIAPPRPGGDPEAKLQAMQAARAAPKTLRTRFKRRLGMWRLKKEAARRYGS